VTLTSELAEGRTSTGVDRPDRGPPDVREDDAPHAVPPGGRGDLEARRSRAGEA
jgi:hypothetical protein